MSNLQQELKNPNLICIVGLPGSGKSTASNFLADLGLPVVRFGDITDRLIKENKSKVSEENEKKVRNDLRKKFGMNIYAVESMPFIDEAFKKNNIVIIDGLYSWEEYKYLLEEYKNIHLVYIFTPSKIRHERLKNREVRPLSKEEAMSRDFNEIEKLNKGGPIAMSDYVIFNTRDKKYLEDELLKLINQIKSL